MTAAQKCETPLAGGAFAKATQAGPDSIVTDADANRKVIASMKARLAMAGHAVHELADGGFLVVATKWAGCCRECPDLRALTAFARQVGALQ